jgi:hypothetical protein
MSDRAGMHVEPGAQAGIIAPGLRQPLPASVPSTAKMKAWSDVYRVFKTHKNTVRRP